MDSQIFTIFDTETTGLYPSDGDKIIEIAALKMQGTTILEREVFESFVNPQREIPYESTRVNNITDDMVKDAPLITEVLSKFLDFVGDSIVVAHNASFDMGFVEKELLQINPFAQVPTAICTKILSRKLNPQEKHHNLDTLAYRYSIELPGEGRHRALVDVELLAAVFKKLIEEGNIQDIGTLLSLASLSTEATVQKANQQQTLL